MQKLGPLGDKKTMDGDQLLPDLVWYVGTPFDGTKVSFAGARAPDGRIYTCVWRQEPLARKFAAQSPPSSGFSVRRAEVEKLVPCWISAGVQWVVIDPPKDSDGILDDPSLDKLNCGRAGDIWPYISAFASQLDMPPDGLEALRKYAKANPELPPLEMIAGFTATMDALGDFFKPPDHECSKCGEKMWRLEELSPTGASSLWSCDCCGKRTRRRTRAGSDGAQTPKRQPIPKPVQREVWRRDQGKCVECGSQENLEFDHIIPVSRGGANTARNIQLMCESCNRSKSDKEPGD